MKFSIATRRPMAASATCHRCRARPTTATSQRARKTIASISGKQVGLLSHHWMKGEKVRKSAPAKSSSVLPPVRRPKKRKALRRRPNVLKFQEKEKARSGLRKKNGHIWGRNQVDQWCTGRLVTSGVTSLPMLGFDAPNAGERDAWEKINGVWISHSSERTSFGEPSSTLPIGISRPAQARQRAVELPIRPKR